MEFRGLKDYKAGGTVIATLPPFVYLVVIAITEQQPSGPAISSISMPQSRIMISFTYLFLPLVVIETRQRQKQY